MKNDEARQRDVVEELARDAKVYGLQFGFN
jgi:hypothetical protein